MDNIILKTDSYKFTHWKQYPPGTEKVYSYFESRGGEFDTVVFFGLQYFLKRYLTGKVFGLADIDFAEEFVTGHLGKDLFNRDGWEYILHRYGGKLPVVISAVPEGSVVPVSTPLISVENTDPNCYWLTNYLETLLVQVWYPCTVATLSKAIKKNILNFLVKNGTPETIDFKLHDFGFRGVSSVESAGIGGAAHLVNFMGTDTVEALVLLAKYYSKSMAGFSIPASEHSTITSWGQDNERLAFENMLTQYPSGLVACVSDSYDIYKACHLWGTELKKMVLARDGCLVVRPDSGHPPTVVCEVLEILYHHFGGGINSKGYKVLDPHIRVIQGDGIDLVMVNEILSRMDEKGFSADNIAFGMGGALLQKLHRDTQKFAFKCSNITINGEDRPVFKNPVGDPGKMSKRGRFKGLIEVFRNGEMVKEWSFDEIRNKASAS